MEDLNPQSVDVLQFCLTTISRTPESSELSLPHRQYLVEPLHRETSSLSANWGTGPRV